GGGPEPEAAVGEPGGAHRPADHEVAGGGTEHALGALVVGGGNDSGKRGAHLLSPRGRRSRKDEACQNDPARGGQVPHDVPPLNWGVKSIRPAARKRRPAPNGMNHRFPEMPASGGRSAGGTA